MYQRLTAKKNNVPIFIVLAIACFIAGSITLLALEKFGVTDIHKSTVANANLTSGTGEVPSANPTNTVDYSPASSSDNQPVPDKSVEPVVTPSNPDLDATITRATKNQAGDSFLIKVAVLGTANGTCSATMKNGELTASSNGSIVLSGGQYACSGLDIPSSQVSQHGTWILTVTVADNNGATKQAIQEVEL